MIVPEGNRHRLRRCLDHLSWLHCVALADEDSHVGRTEVDHGCELALNSDAAGVAAGPAGAACRYIIYLFCPGIDYRQEVGGSIGRSQKHWVLTGALISLRL